MGNEKRIREKVSRLDILLDDVLPTMDEQKQASDYVDTLSKGQLSSKMTCLRAFARSNPSNAGVKSTRGSTRLEYLIKYLVFQQRKATAKTESVPLGTGSDELWCTYDTVFTTALQPSAGGGHEV